TPWRQPLGIRWHSDFSERSQVNPNKLHRVEKFSRANCFSTARTGRIWLVRAAPSECGIRNAERGMNGHLSPALSPSSVVETMEDGVGGEGEGSAERWQKG